VSVLVGELFPLATIVTPNLHEACALARVPYAEDADRRGLAEAIRDLGAPAVVVTGGHGEEAVDWLFDGERHVPIPVERYGDEATHGAGCTHSASLAGLLAWGESLEDAARGAAAIASDAVRNGLAGLGAGSGPVDVFRLGDREARGVRAPR
jgi:hydroxymethylpyrimidine/phosphomethylpyrimidine kinase